MNIPTKITVSRIALIAFMLIGIFTLQIICAVNPSFANFCSTWNIDIGNGLTISWIYLIIGIVFIVASVTDYFDGHLARKWNQVTDLGKFLDPIADKLLVDSIIIFLMVEGVPFHGANQAIWPLFSGIVIIARDLIIDALRSIAATKRQVIAANYWGKAKTVLEMIAIPIMLINGWPFSYFDANWGAFRICYIVIYAATIVAVISAVFYLKDNWRVLKENPAISLVKTAKEKGVTFGSCESITGGMFANEVTQISGASACYKGSAITYATELKNKILGVDKNLIEEKGVVSAEVAQEMARLGREILNVDYCISCTGNAGPTVCEDNKPVGRVYIAIADKNGVKVEEFNLTGKRNDIQKKVTEKMIFIIYNNLNFGFEKSK